jgi:hypothetical protein
MRISWDMESGARDSNRRQDPITPQRAVKYLQENALMLKELEAV